MNLDGVCILMRRFPFAANRPTPSAALSLGFLEFGARANYQDQILFWEPSPSEFALSQTLTSGGDGRAFDFTWESSRVVSGHFLTGFSNQVWWISDDLGGRQVAMTAHDGG